MKIALIIIIVLIVSAIALMFVLGKQSQKGLAPGLVNGSLSKCSEKPNCVCSEYGDNVSHFIEPIKVNPELERHDMSRAASIINDMNGLVNSVEDNYIAATFISSTFGFVDDFEIRTDPNKGVMHIRSASRVGYSDGGINKKRVELFKSLYKKK